MSTPPMRPVVVVHSGGLTREEVGNALVVPDDECTGCSPERARRAQQAMGAGSQGVWTATTFSPPADLRPSDVFGLHRFKYFTGISERFLILSCHVPALGSPRTIAVYTDGACADNGAGVGGNTSTREPRAGCAFVYREGDRGTFSWALEKKGPDGETYQHTSNRAELRAVLAALKFRYWPGEGWDRLVIVTDSEYVSHHATEWLRKWAERGWRTAAGQPVKNQDLWKAVSVRMGELAMGGVEVSFWAVPRSWNTTADQAAKKATTLEPNDEFFDVQGALC